MLHSPASDPLVVPDPEPAPITQLELHDDLNVARSRPGSKRGVDANLKKRDVGLDDIARKL
jgi:hypothetical protein